MEENKKLDIEELDEVSGGKTYYGTQGRKGLDYDGPWKTVANLKVGYLAVRTDPTYDDRNIIGKLYNGNNVQVVGNGSGNGYVWVWAPICGCSGWVNGSYLI